MDIEVSHLGSGVNTTVGAASTMNANLLMRRNAIQDAFNFGLDSALVGLTLPAMQMGTDVLNGQSHSLSFTLGQYQPFCQTLRQLTSAPK
jgi:hypothetical protein